MASIIVQGCAPRRPPRVQHLGAALVLVVRGGGPGAAGRRLLRLLGRLLLQRLLVPANKSDRSEPNQPRFRRISETDRVEQNVRGAMESNRRHAPLAALLRGEPVRGPLGVGLPRRRALTVALPLVAACAPSQGASNGARTESKQQKQIKRSNIQT
jgi:hypothetical protein